LVAFGILMAGAAVVTAAPVTLILKSGDRVRGDLVDLKTAGFVLNVRGAEQQIAREEVAALAFTNAEFPAAEAAKIQGGRALVVLKSGDTFYGSLADIGGTSPLRLSFRTPDGDRETTSDEVARIYFSKWQGMPETGTQEAALDPGGAGMTIPANACWTNTARSVRQGQRVTFNGTGEIQLSADPKDIAGVAGSRTGRTSPGAPIPGALAGALIGRVGNGRPFGIGDQTIALSMPATGQLWLGINDDHCGDNRGQFKVQINILR
jgi:small nuclear ribonucleoprotein (snRNP)-like protein